MLTLISAYLTYSRKLDKAYKITNNINKFKDGFADDLELY